MATGSADGRIWLWEANDRIGGLARVSERESFEEARFGPLEHELVTISHDETVRPIVRLWDLRNGEILGVFRDPKAWSAKLRPDVAAYVTISNVGEVFLWDARNGHQISMLRKGENKASVASVRFSEDGQRLIVGVNNTRAELLDAQTGVKIRDIAAADDTDRLTNGIMSEDFGVDGSWAVTVSVGGVVKLWDANFNSEARAVQTDATVVVASPDLRKPVFATGSNDGVVRLWDAHGGRQLREMRGHKGRVNFVRFSADGALIATSAVDGTTRVWEISTGTELGVFRGVGPDHLLDSTFTRDARNILVPLSRGTVGLWRLPSWRSSEQMIGYARTLPLGPPDREWCSESGVQIEQCEWPPHF